MFNKSVLTQKLKIPPVSGHQNTKPPGPAILTLFLQKRCIQLFPSYSVIDSIESIETVRRSAVELLVCC